MVNVDLYNPAFDVTKITFINPNGTKYFVREMHFSDGEVYWIDNWNNSLFTKDNVISQFKRAAEEATSFIYDGIEYDGFENIISKQESQYSTSVLVNSATQEKTNNWLYWILGGIAVLLLLKS